MWKAVHDGLPFWEMRFGMAFRQKCIDAAQSVVRQSSESVQQRAFGSAASGATLDVDEISDPHEDRIDDEVAARLSSTAHQELLLSAVRRLPKRQGAAALFAWIEGRTIEGQGPDTVSSLMAITPRAVRMLLANARRTLQSDPAIRAIWFGET
jgi:DNA-directed RNA polymerase specialized sigma24 family protein